jgi:hypothetical protein
MEEKTPHTEEVAGWQYPEILTARKSSERLLRRRRQFGERVGVEEEIKRFSSPQPLLI